MIETIITSSVLILIIIALRYLLRGHISSQLQYTLWMLAAIRLLLPFPLFENPVSVMNILPDTQTFVPADMQQAGGSPPAEGALTGNHTPVVQNSRSAAGPAANTTPIVWTARYIWLCGMLLTGVFFAVSNARLGRKLKQNRRQIQVPGSPLPVYLTDHLPSPCLYGIPKPAVYLTPDSLADEKRTAFVLAHELTHYRHRDYLWALIRIFCLCIHWFNPLVWLAAVLSRRDSELACDEGTLGKLGSENRMEYGRMIIEMSTAPAKPSQLFCCATTMTGGKKEMTERIRCIARQPKTLLISLAAVVIVTVTAVAITFGSAANRGESKPEEAQVLNPQELWNARTAYVGDNAAEMPQYRIAKLENGKVLSEVPLEDGGLANAIIMDVMVKSAAWEGSDISALSECYQIRQTFPNANEIHDYYAYLPEDGRAVLQSGTDGFCSVLSQELYSELLVLWDNLTGDPWLANSYTEGVPRPDFDHLLWMTPDDEKGYCAVCYQDVSREQMEAYLQTLAADGWQTLRDFYEDTTVGGLYEKGSRMISIQFAGQQVVLYFSSEGA